MEDLKQCEQCKERKSLSAFHRRKNKTDGRMKICAECYMANLHNTQRAIKEQQQARKQQQLEESERLKTTVSTLLKGTNSNANHIQGSKVCQRCQQEFPTNAHGALVVPFFSIHSTTCERCGKPLSIEYPEDGMVHYWCSNHIAGGGPTWYGYSQTHCPPCDEERRKKNRQAYPLCPMCNTPTSVANFLRKYHGYRLDIIRVCCMSCLPSFQALSDQEQQTLLRQAMIKAYGETATIYALQYDDTFLYHHIGRTKHFKKRMGQYRRNWYRDIQTPHVLEEVAFGPLSMERESRWILHALKHGWPIDNFHMFDPDKLAQQETEHPLSPDVMPLLSERRKEIHANQLQEEKELTAAAAEIEPLTAPFEEIEPLLKYFQNTSDVHIVHWFLTTVEKEGERRGKEK